MNIKIIYFTYLVPNKWEPIVLEQLEALYKITSLYEQASIYISLTVDSESQNEFKKLRNIISSKYNKIQFINVFSKNVYEYPGLKSVYEVSTDNDSEYNESEFEEIDVTDNPLYQVLSAFFETEEGENVCDILKDLGEAVRENTKMMSKLLKPGRK